MGIFTKKEKERQPEPSTESSKKVDKANESEWKKCKFCKEQVLKRDLERNLDVCPKCSYHFPVTADKRIALTFDRGSFTEYYKNVAAVDFLGFKDLKSYRSRLDEAKEATGRNDTVVCGRGRIEGMEVLCAIFDFSFLGGSLGSVAGEKITRLLEEGLKKRLPVIVFCASGGARMQEGIVSLMQMAKTSGAIERLKAAGIPYITVLTDATTGGVTASVGMLGDIIIGEPKVMIGFAGAAVIKETIKEELPPGFQRAEFLLEHGMIDLVCHRAELKQKLYNILSLIVA
jgi:acetyl-CoA carboxylase carboxyl transferase subunit beta